MAVESLSCGLVLLCPLMRANRVDSTSGKPALAKGKVCRAASCDHWFSLLFTPIRCHLKKNNCPLYVKTPKSCSAANLSACGNICASSILFLDLALSVTRLEKAYSGMQTRHHRETENIQREGLRIHKPSLAMFQSPFRQNLICKTFTCHHRPQLPIVRSQTPLALHPFRHNMSIALRAMRENGCGMQ
jgi:hypothetical protein